MGQMSNRQPLPTPGWTDSIQTIHLFTELRLLATAVEIRSAGGIQGPIRRTRVAPTLSTVRLPSQSFEWKTVRV